MFTPARLPHSLRVLRDLIIRLVQTVDTWRREAGEPDNCPLCIVPLGSPSPASIKALAWWLARRAGVVRDAWGGGRVGSEWTVMDRCCEQVGSVHFPP